MEYRPEIDGLRALAIIPVILFHAGLQLFSGGFVGVDVFFVVSGYLITSLIINEKQENTFSLINFYERRARRILPALFCMMLACLPLAWYSMPPSDRRDFADTLVVVSTFVSNVYFWRTSGYFDTASELKPLLHTWSLAVEEQYYVLFPIFLLLIWKLGKRWIVATFAVIAIISLAAAQWGSLNKPAFAFFMLPTRGWELFGGGLLAFQLSYKDRDKRINESLSCVGLFLILYAICAFDKHTPFPSVYTLIPTIGAALIIVFGTERTFIGKLLGSKLFVGVGLISYSAYLWHYPLFAFVRHNSIGDPSMLALGASTLTSLLVAYSSWRFVETPLRNRQRIGRNKILLYGALCSGLFVAIGLVGHFYKGIQSRYDLPESISSSFGISLREGCFDKVSVHTREDWLCDLGSKGKPSFIVFGDSHAFALMDALDKAARSVNVYGKFTATSSCPPLLDIYVLSVSQAVSDCHLLNKRVFDYVTANKIEKVFLVARWTYYTDGGYDGKEFVFLGLSKNSQQHKEASRRAFEVGLQNTVKAYDKIGVKVYIVGQAPQQKYDAKKIYFTSYAPYKSKPEFNGNLRSLSVSVQEHHRLQSHVMTVFKFYEGHDNIKVISLDGLFCDVYKCTVGDGDRSYYADDDHLSSAGALLIVNEIKHLIVSSGEFVQIRKNEYRGHVLVQDHEGASRRGTAPMDVSQ
jgi:peptidoglycan/LPS O-acetylase OafA/YrhL